MVVSPFCVAESLWLTDAEEGRLLSMFRDNAALQRFEWTERGHTAFADYVRQGDVLILPHVEAPAALRGTGAAGRLMQAVTEHARAERLRLRPVCSYAVAWLNRHPEQADLAG